MGLLTIIVDQFSMDFNGFQWMTDNTGPLQWDFNFNALFWDHEHFKCRFSWNIMTVLKALFQHLEHLIAGG